MEKMKIEKEKELFDMFVEKDNPLRTKFNKPFIDGTDRRVWATDGHLLLMVSPECVSDEYKVMHLKDKLNVKDYTCKHEISVKELEEAIEKCPKEEQVIISYKEKTCPECDGKGTVDADYRADYDNNYYELEADCPICGGEGTIEEEIETKTGKVKPQEDSVIRIGEGYFFNRYIQLIIKACEILSIDKICMLKNHRTAMSLFALNDDVHLVMMPLYMEKEEFDAEIKIKK